MKKLLLLALMLLPMLALGQAPQNNLATMAATEVVNVRTYGVRCDGVTDDYAHFVSAIAQVPTGGRLYIPPSATACLLSQPLTINSSFTIWAYPGTVTLKPTNGNTSNPVLIAVQANNVTVYGVTMDGGGTANTNTNDVVTTFQISGALFDHVTVQNTRGPGIVLSESTASGVTNSTFTNIANYWATSLNQNDRHPAISFCCTAAGHVPAKNYAIGNYGTNMGLDLVDVGNQSDFQAIANRCDMSTAQDAQSFTNFPGCVFVTSSSTSIVSGNVVTSAPGNCIDISTASGVEVVGNYVTGCGWAGISLDNVTYASVTGNVALNTGNMSTSCERDGIDLLDTDTNFTISANTASDTRSGGSKTMQNGILSFVAGTCGGLHVASLSSYKIDVNNEFDGAAVGAYGGGLTGPTTPADFVGVLSGTCSSSTFIDGAPACRAIAASDINGLSPTLTGNWSFTPSSGNALSLTAASGTNAELITQSASADGLVVIAASGSGASIRLRGNGNAGTAGGQLDQDSSNIVHLANLGNAAIALDTNGSNRMSIAGGGAVTFPSVTTGTNTDFVCMSSGNTLTLQSSACTISSLRFKTNLELLSDADPILRLHVRSFEMKPTGNRDPNATHRQAGLIAEEVADVMPLCAVYEDDMKTPKSYRPECIDAYLVKVAQDHQRVVSRQQWEIYLLMLWCAGLTGWLVYKRRANP